MAAGSNDLATYVVLATYGAIEKGAALSQSLLSTSELSAQYEF